MDVHLTNSRLQRVKENLEMCTRESTTIDVTSSRIKGVLDLRFLFYSIDIY